MSAHRLLAEAVKDALNAATFSIAFNDAARKYEPTRELKEFATLRVTVVPSARRKSILGRSGHQRDVDIDVAIQKKLTAADNAEVDALDDLADEISDWLLKRKVTTFRCVATEDKALWSPDHLKEKKLYTSVVTATFRRVE